mgnify:CR=1 FL=1
MSDNTFGAPKNLLLAGVVLALIILLTVNVTLTYAWPHW